MEDLKNIINSSINIEKKNADAKYGELKSNEYAFLMLKEECRELELETGIIMDNIEYLNGIHLKYLNKNNYKVVKEIRRRAVLAACEAVQVATVCDRWLEKHNTDKLLKNIQNLIKLEGQISEYDALESNEDVSK